MSADDDYDEYEIEYTTVSKTITEIPAAKSNTILSSGSERDQQPTHLSAIDGDNGVDTKMNFIRRQQQQSERRKSSITQPAGIYMLYGKDLSEYDSIPVDEILAKLSPQELEQLSNEVDPDDTLLPPSQRCKDQTTKSPTGPLSHEKLIEYLAKYAIEQPDWPESKRYEPGAKKGKVFVPRRQPSEPNNEIPIMLDLDDDSSRALDSATEADLVDLAGILGLHSMLNQDQYYASITNKSQKNGDKFESIVKSTPLKQIADEPDNITDPAESIERIAKNDPTLKEVNLNNVKHITRDTFKRLFESLKTNTNLKTLNLSNVGLTDGPAAKLVDVLKENTTLRTINLESNFLSGVMIRSLIEALLEKQRVLEFRACNQRPQILGNRVEMEITKLVEKNNTLVRLGLNFDVPDARMRVAKHLQDNIDNIRLTRIGVQPKHHQQPQQLQQQPIEA